MNTPDVSGKEFSLFMLGVLDIMLMSLGATKQEDGIDDRQMSYPVHCYLGRCDERLHGSKTVVLSTLRRWSRGIITQTGRGGIGQGGDVFPLPGIKDRGQASQVIVVTKRQYSQAIENVPRSSTSEQPFDGISFPSTAPTNFNIQNNSNLSLLEDASP